MKTRYSLMKIVKILNEVIAGAFWLEEKVKVKPDF